MDKEKLNTENDIRENLKAIIDAIVELQQQVAVLNGIIQP